MSAPSVVVGRLAPTVILAGPGRLAQSVRALPSHGRGRGFESRIAHPCDLHKRRSHAQSRACARAPYTLAMRRNGTHLRRLLATLDSRSSHGAQRVALGRRVVGQSGARRPSRSSRRIGARPSARAGTARPRPRSSARQPRAEGVRSRQRRRRVPRQLQRASTRGTETRPDAADRRGRREHEPVRLAPERLPDGFRPLG